MTVPETSFWAYMGGGPFEPGGFEAYVHIVLPSGISRDTVSFPVIAAEWPAVRERLTARLSAF